MATIDAKSLPNYQHPDYKRMMPVLQLLQDVYNGLEGVKPAYLKQEPREPKGVYDNRVDRAVFTNKLRPTIESNAGLLTAFELANLPATVEANLDNLDGQGSDYKAFFHEADVMALRDRHCFILVDYPADEVATEADRMASDRRPNFTLIDRRNVLNWQTRYSQGRLTVEAVTIRIESEEPDGTFATKKRPQFHHMRKVAGGVQHTVWEAKDEREQPVAVKTTTLALKEIPLVCYPFTAKPFSCDQPPFLKLARLNIKLFRKESALDEIEYRVNVPTVWRKHPADVPKNPPPITFGASWVMEIPSGGEVGVLEVQGSGIAALQTSIDKLKDEIESEGLAFLAGSTVQRTATESFLSSAQVQSTLSGMARDKGSAIQRCFDFWCEYTGEENTVEMQMDNSVLEMPLDASEMSTLMSSWQAGAISHETLLNLWKMGKQLPPTFDVAEELERVETERAAMQAAIAPSIETI